MRLRARHYATEERIEITCAGGLVQSIAAASPDPVDLEAEWAAPAFFDLQINGCLGHGFHSEHLSTDVIRAVIAECRRHGIGAFFPTLITNSHEALARGLGHLRRACESDPAIAHALPGIHLEGPFLSPEDGPRGAHPKQHVRAPDWNEYQRLQEAAGGLIRLVTLAPEWDDALSMIERLTAANVVVAIGHTAASGQRIRDAISAGAKLSTHLGNGCHAMLPRHKNYLWEQLAADELWASLICDGHHLPPAVARCMIRAKTPARTILTCDASPLAGAAPGKYVDWDQELEVLSNGKVVLAGTPYLAGSGAFTDTCVDVVLQHCDVSLKDAVDMAGAHPRELLDLPSLQLVEGQPADLILFDYEPGGSFRITTTVIGGAVVNGTSTPAANHSGK